MPIAKSFVFDPHFKQRVIYTLLFSKVLFRKLCDQGSRSRFAVKRIFLFVESVLLFP